MVVLGMVINDTGQEAVILYEVAQHLDVVAELPLDVLILSQCLDLIAVKEEFLEWRPEFYGERLEVGVLVVAHDKLLQLSA